MMVFSLSAVSADDVQTNCTDEVSGGVDVVTTNPWSTTGEATYDIPSEATDIQSATVYVNVYAGSAKNTYGANANVSLITDNGENQIASEQLWIEEGSSDGKVYPVNDHVDKCYSDYQMVYDITDSLKGLNGSSIAIHVKTFAMENKSFDGRIKLIGLVLAYNDGDNDKIAYWVDSSQRWTKTNVTTVFNTKDVSDVINASLTNIVLSSTDGSYMINNEIIGDPIENASGNYYKYNRWDITDKFDEGKDIEFFSMNVGTGSYSSLKNVLTVLKVQSDVINADVSLATEYTSVNTCFAGTNNTLTIKANSNKQGDYLIELLADGTIVDIADVKLDGENATKILLTDPTIRAIDETTVSGADNNKVVYAVNVRYNDAIVASANKTVPVLYNGYLGKDMAYNATYIEDIEKITVSGGFEFEVLDDKTYMSSGSTNRTDVITVELPKDSSFEKAFAYIAYNWDKSGVAGPVFNVTFNGKDIVPKSQYRDQSNLGSSGKYGYGLFVYDVTDLIVEGNNTLILNKASGLTAVYPTALLYFYNTTGTDYVVNAYIANGADLLANSYNNAGRLVSTSSVFNVDTKSIISEPSAPALFVFAASAQKGEGNIIFNGVESTNVWNGSSNSLEFFELNISDISEVNNVSFVATGSTILALQQILLTCEKAPAIKTIVTPKALVTTYASGKAFYVTVLDANKKPIKGLELNLMVYTGNKYATFKVVTDKNGVASLKASKLAIGTHKVVITSNDASYEVKKTTSSIKIAKAKTVTVAPKIKVKAKKNKYFKVTVIDKTTKRWVSGLKLKVSVFTGKKYKTYTVKTNKKGAAYLNTKTFSVGTHKVYIASGNANFVVSQKSSIVVKK